MFALRLWSYGVWHHHFSGNCCLIFRALFILEMEVVDFCPMLVPVCLSTWHLTHKTQ